MSNSVRPHPWDSPGKNTGVGCHFLLQCIKVKSESEVAQSCLTLCHPTDCSLPGSSIHGIFHGLEWGAIAFSGLTSLVALNHVSPSHIRDWTHIPCIGRKILSQWTTREVSIKDCLEWHWQGFAGRMSWQRVWMTTNTMWSHFSDLCWDASSFYHHCFCLICEMSSQWKDNWHFRIIMKRVWILRPLPYFKKGLLWSMYYALGVGPRILLLKKKHCGKIDITWNLYFNHFKVHSSVTLSTFPFPSL